MQCCLRAHGHPIFVFQPCPLHTRISSYSGNHLTLQLARSLVSTSASPTKPSALWVTPLNPSQALSSPLPSGKRYQSIRVWSSRLLISFTQQAARRFNSVHILPAILQNFLIKGAFVLKTSCLNVFSPYN